METACALAEFRGVCPAFFFFFFSCVVLFFSSGVVLDCFLNMIQG